MRYMPRVLVIIADFLNSADDCFMVFQYFKQQTTELRNVVILEFYSKSFSSGFIPDSSQHTLDDLAPLQFIASIKWVLIYTYITIQNALNIFSLLQRRYSGFYVL